MSHKLLHTHKQELKKLKADTEKERKTALKKIKGKKEKKSFVSTFKKIAKEKEDEMLERHHREVDAEANDKSNDTTTTFTEGKSVATATTAATVASTTVDGTPTEPSAPSPTPAAATTPATTAVATAASVSLILPPASLNTTKDQTNVAPEDDDAWEQVNHKKVRNKKVRKGKRYNNKNKSSASSSINKKALGALTSDAICTELRRGKTKKILSLGCRTEAQLVSRVRDCAPLVDEICCVDDDAPRVRAVMESIVGGTTSFSTRPRQKTLNVQLIVGSPWYWTTEIYEGDEEEGVEEEEEAQEAQEEKEKVEQEGETKTATATTSGDKSISLTEELMKKVMTCGGDTVVLGMVLETMPHSVCLQRLETYLVDVLKPNKIIIAAPPIPPAAVPPPPLKWWRWRRHWTTAKVRKAVELVTMY